MSINLPPEYVAAGIWLWENFSKDLIKSLGSSAKDKLDKEWKKVEWSLASKKYRNRVHELYSTMRILGVPSPVPLDGIYTDVRVLDKPTAYTRYDIQKLKESHSYSGWGYMDKIHRSVNALDEIKEKDSLFILGKPGAGKTTLLKHLTLLAAKGEIEKVPIFVSLNDWSQRSQNLMSQHDLIDYIVQQFEICSFPDAQLFIENVLLKKGRAIVLFDGLDEVNEENQKRNQVTRIISDFTNQYPDNKYVVTCRVAATDYTFEKFRYVEIADFSEEQIGIFVRKWFYSFPEKGERFIRDINLSKNKGLYELARTPILLSLLCINFDETLSFPERRNEIYQEAIDALLKKWDSSRNIKRDEIYHGLSSLRKRQLLSRIAAEYFQNGEIFFSVNSLVKSLQVFMQTLPEVKDEVDGEIVLKAMEAQHGILVERARGIYSFSHLSLQEFFTSQYIIENLSKQTFKQLMEHLGDSKWHEVFMMTAGALPNADIFFSEFSARQKSFIAKAKSLKKLSRVLSSYSQLAPLQRVKLFVISNRYDLSDKQFNIPLSIAYKKLGELINLLNDRADINEFPNIMKRIKGGSAELSLQLRDLGSKESRSSEKIRIRVLVDSIYEILDPDNKDYRSTVGEAGAICNAIKSVQGALEDLSNRRVAKNDIVVEMATIKDHLLSLQKEVETSINRLESLSRMIGADVTNDEWYSTLDTVDIEEFQTYLYVHLLLLECLNVSAVSERDSIVGKTLFV